MSEEKSQSTSPPHSKHCTTSNHKQHGGIVSRRLQINHLAHFLLVLKLRGLLERNAPSRVVLVSSICHSWEAIAWEDLQAESGYEKYVQYSQSKLMNHLFAFALDRRLAEAGSGLRANVVEPGVISTKLLRNGIGSGGSPIQQGPVSQIHAAIDDGVAGKGGLYFNASARQTKADAKAYSHQDQERLWQLSLQILNSHGFTL